MAERRRSMLIFLAALAAALQILAAPAAAREGQSRSSSDWPQFRGANVDGISVETGVFSGAVGLEVEWRVPLGSGYSSVSILDGLAVTMFDDGEAIIVVAFDAGTGEERWRTPIGSHYRGHDGSYDGPMSTPLVTEFTTVALGPDGRLVALRNEDGSVQWSTDLMESEGAPLPLYGFATSPILEGGNVVLQTGGTAGTVAGFDLDSGERRWAAGTDTVDYQNAIPWVRDGQRLILAAGFSKVMGIDPLSGALLWESDHGGGGARGVWSMVPVVAGPDRVFLAFKDTASALFRLDGPVADVVASPLWEERSIRNSYAVAVYNDGYIYAYSSRFLTCVDAATGQPMWKSRAPGDGFLILVDGHLVVQTKAGSLHVAKATPEGYQEVAGLDLFNELAWAPPSFADGSIFVRSLNELARVGVRAATTTPEDSVPARTGSGPDGVFGEFLRRVEAAADKDRLVDDFLAAQSSFPLIEGDSTVHFLYRGAAEDMAIAGDMVGARQESPMQRVPGTDLFYYSADLLPDARVNYLFIRDYEPILDPLNPRRTGTALFGDDMEMQAAGNRQELAMSWLAMPGWSRPAHLAEPPAGAPRGRLEEHSLRSEALDDERTLSVYLPAGYDGSEDRYPVVYLHGGYGALGRGEWPTSLDNLVGHTVEPVIVAFIDPPAGGIFDPRDAYGDFWAGELVPFMDRTFRTVANADGRAHAGAGLGAHDALYCSFKYPEMSSRIAIQSLAMVDYGRQPLVALIGQASERPLEIYMEWGVYDLQNPQEAWDARDFSRDMVEFLRGRGYTVDAREFSDGAGWSSWKYRNDLVLEHLYPLTAR